MSCLASFALFVLSLKTLIDDTDRLSCLLYVEAAIAGSGPCYDEIYRPHACVTALAICINTLTI